MLEIWCLLQWADDQEDPVFLVRLKDEDLVEAPDDSAFLQSLRFSCARVSGVYPPLALAEAFITEEDSAPRVRRLHLMVVDPHRRRRMADRVLKLLVDIQVDRCADDLSVGSLHDLVFCFTRFHKVLGWSSCLALSNQQACVRPCCFTGRPRPLGTGFFNGSFFFPALPD